jgi:hypothetical protein
MTRDGLTKPELCAPGALVAAPILPGTPMFDKARTLYFGRALTETELRTALASRPELGIDPASLDDAGLRTRLEQEIRDLKLVGPHYQHVDGTSFAAPIVTSVVAQMLEACPTLTPRAVRDVLIATARPLPHIPRERQGYGLVQPLAAVQAAESPTLPVHARRFEEPRVEGRKVTFHYPADAGRVAVSGTFNQWDRQGLPLQRGEAGRWEATVELPFPGRHLYKFIVDGQYWVEDEANPRTEPDSYGGTNSVFATAEHAFADELASRVFDDLHSDKPPEEKALARSSLDFALSLPNAAANTAVEAYYRRCLEAAVARLGQPGPPSGIEILQLYNCGVVIRTAGLAVGIDVVTGRHVWGVNWPIADELVRGLAEHLDLLLVTQRLPDHLDLDVVRAVGSAGGTVVVPEEVRTTLAGQVTGMAAGAVRTIALPAARSRYARTARYTVATRSEWLSARTKCASAGPPCCTSATTTTRSSPTARRIPTSFSPRSDGRARAWPRARRSSAWRRPCIRGCSSPPMSRSLGSRTTVERTATTRWRPGSLPSRSLSGS